MRATQDDARENEQIRIFELEPLQGRSNKYIPDATIKVGGQEHKIELKTSNVVNQDVSTSSRVTLSKIEEWQEVWWVFSQYQNTPAGFEFTGEHYVANAQNLEPFFEEQRKKITNGTKTYGGLSDWETCKKLLSEQQVSPDMLKRLNNSFHKRGCALNDPKIRWNKVKKMATRLDSSRLASHLKEIIAESTGVR